MPLIDNIWGGAYADTPSAEKWTNPWQYDWYERWAKSSSPKRRNAMDKGSLEATVADLGATPSALMVDDIMPVADHLTIPATMTYEWLQGLIAPASTKVLTVLGPIVAPLTVQIFGGAGSVSFVGNVFVPTVSVKWFGALGDGVADDGPAIRKAVQAVVDMGGGEVFFPPGTYLIQSSTAFGGLGQVCMPVSSDHVTFRGIRGASRIIIDSTVIAAAIGLFGDATASTMPAAAHSIQTAARGASSITTVTAAHAGNYSIDDWILIRGQELATEALNPDSEINRVISVNAGTGVIGLAYPLTKRYATTRAPLNNSAYPALITPGIVNINAQVVEGFLLQNLTITHRGSGVICLGRFSVNSKTDKCDLLAHPTDTGIAYGPASFGGRFHTITNSLLEVDSGGSSNAGALIAPDVSCSDLSMMNCEMRIRGYAIIHIAEGAANIRITNCILRVSVQGAGAALDWTLIPLFFAYDTHIAHNLIYLEGASRLQLINLAGPAEGLVFAENSLILQNMHASNPTIDVSFSDINQWQNISIKGNSARGDSFTVKWPDFSSGLLGTLEVTNPADLRSLTGPGLPAQGIWPIGHRLAHYPPTPATESEAFCTRAGRAAPPWAASTAYYAPWQASTAYVAGNRVIPDTTYGNALGYVCTTPGTSGATPPAWPGSGTVADGDIVWTLDTFVGYNFQLYRRYVIDIPDNGHVYLIEKGGLTSSSKPTLPTGSGDTVTDGTVTLKEAGPSALFETVSAGATSGPEPVYKVTTEGVTSSTTLQADDALAFASLPVGVHYLKFVVFTFNAGSSEGIKFALDGTVVPFSVIGKVTIFNDSGDTVQQSGVFAALNSAVGAVLPAGFNHAEIEASINVQTEGSIALYWAQQSSGSDTSYVWSGSWVIAQKILTLGA